MNLDPIFVHASPRSGSTYFFNVLRRDPSLMCFNETISDTLSYRNWRPPQWNVNHPFLQYDDQQELKIAARVGIRPPKFATFLNYGGLSREWHAYFFDLINFAQTHGKRPVFCEIYSRRRASALRKAFGGFHIAQIRDAEAQLGSCIRALVEGGEWGYLTLPLLEEFGLPVNRADRWAESMYLMSRVHLMTVKELRAFHSYSWQKSNGDAIRASDMVLDLDNWGDRNGISERLGVSFYDYKLQPQYPIPTEAEWQKIGDDNVSIFFSRTVRRIAKPFYYLGSFAKTAVRTPPLWQIKSMASSLRMFSNSVR